MRRRDDRGIALILALLVLTILIILIAQMSVTSLHDRTLSDNRVADLQNTYGTRSGYHLALLYLQADQEQGSSTDSSQDKWWPPLSVQLGRAQVRVDIHDSERFLNLSLLVNDKGEANPAAAAQLRRLVELLRHPPEMADRILDYVDADTRGNFETRARNERLTNIDELLRIEGLTPPVLFGGRDEGGETKKGLMEFVTIWPKPAAGAPGRPPVAASSLVNLNTAPAEVFQCLSSEMTPLVAEEIVAYRTQSGGDGRPRTFGSAEELKKVNGMTDAIFNSIADKVTVKSETFEIKVRSTVGNVEKAWVYVVRRTGGQKGEIKLVASQRMNDFISVRPPAIEE